jgi:Protein of unknown function (DUF3011)
VRLAYGETAQVWASELVNVEPSSQLSFTVLEQGAGIFPLRRSSMNPRSYFTLSVLVLGVLGSVLSTSAQKNSTQATVSSVVSCVSTGDQRQHCAADTSAGVVMLRPTGETACLLGRNWGYDAQGVWVSEGCGGDFATGSASRSAKVSVEVSAHSESAEQQADLAAVTTGTNPEVHYFGMFNPYGSLRNIVSISDSGAQVQDNASRAGINFSTFGAIKVFATGEWGVNLVRSETTFNAGATTEQGFGVISQGTQSVFGARLGFLGVDFGRFGRLSFGKENSTHYDIAGYTTDRFNVFGGTSTTTYVAGTDGGQDWHRGGGHPPTPATPPCVRVRTRRFELVALAPIDQGRKPKRFEVDVGKPHGEGFGPSEVPGAASAASRISGEPRTNA